MSATGTTAARTSNTSAVPAGQGPFAVEFLGWLPVFKRFGNCGAHPQFAHTHSPPKGYAFRTSAPATRDETPTRAGRLAHAVFALGLSLWVLADTARKHGLLRALRTFLAFVRFTLMLVRKTGRVVPSLRFAHSRNFQSQVLAPRTELAFLTSVPYTYGQNPWVIEIEDPTTLFFPFVQNGRTATLDVRKLSCFGAVKALLEADSCRGIVTHMRSTAELLPVLFGSERIARKITYAPLGLPLPTRHQTHDSDGPINLLFTNSWHQLADGFFFRGGLDVLEAFDVLRRRYPQVRLTVRSAIPKLDERHYRMLESGWVRVIDRFMPAAELARLQAESHIYLLPAARIHIVSVLQAMSYGQAVVVSDGWGMSEYIEHGATGLVVPGRGGTVSWADPASGMLREDYRPMFAPDRKVIDGLVESVSLLIEQQAVRRRLGAAAREAVATRFTPDNWNAALGAAFDKARGIA